MNKELIELQRGCKATCVVIPDAYYKYLGQTLSIDASIDDEFLFARPIGNPAFKEGLDIISNNKDLTYFVIRGIDKLTTDMQNRYIGLVKDREFEEYNLPDNVIIVFTVNDKEGLQKISKQLYHFCVVAF